MIRRPVELLYRINAQFQIKNRIIFFFKEAFSALFFLRRPHGWSCVMAKPLGELQYIVGKKDQCFRYVAVNPILRWRAKTLFSKGPETIDWLEKMRMDDVLFDIGANVGMYSIYAGKRGVRVFGFGPESSHFYIFNKNIQINNLSSFVSAYNFALSDKEVLDKLGLTSLTPGPARTTFSNNKQFNQTGKPTLFEQGCMSTTLDNLILKYKMSTPNYLKIDVDGIEAKIIQGGQNLINNLTLRSILIELNDDLENDQWVKTYLNQKGFKIVNIGKGMQAQKNKNTIRNYIFERV